MSESIFRKKNLDRMKTPDTLDKYIQVANPGTWIVLAFLVCFIIGIVVWNYFGILETVVPAHAYVENDTAVLEVLDDRIDTVEPGQKVYFYYGNAEGTVWKVNKSENTVIVKAEVPDGVYDAEIVTETIRPIQLIFD